MNNLLERIKNNYPRLIFTILIVLAIPLLIWLISRDQTSLTDDTPTPTPTPPSITNDDIGFNNQTELIRPSSFVTEDPIKTPETMSVYELLPGPDEIFGTTGIASIASVLEFTAAAEVSPTNDGYYYFQQGKNLTISKNTSTLQYSEQASIQSPTTSSLPAPQEAIDIARSFVTKIGFNNPLIDWNSSEIQTYTITSGGPAPSVGISENGYYSIQLQLKLNELELIFPQEMYVNIHANGSVIGASLWYPSLNIESPKTQNIVGFLTALERLEMGDGVYRGDLNQFQNQEVKFNQTEVAYVVPNQFLHNSTTIRTIVPVYVFSNDSAKIYVSALPE